MRSAAREQYARWGTPLVRAGPADSFFINAQYPEVSPDEAVASWKAKRLRQCSSTTSSQRGLYRWASVVAVPNLQCNREVDTSWWCPLPGQAALPLTAGLPH